MNIGPVHVRSEDAARILGVLGIAAFFAGVGLGVPVLVVAGIASVAAAAIWFQKLQESVPNEHIVCKHCQEQGTVHAGIRQRKTGISGGKATGAVMTGGMSLLATGLSRKQSVTHLWCDNCKMEWDES